MADLEHQHDRERLRDKHRQQRNLHRRAHVLAGVKTRSQDLDGDQAQQSEAVTKQCGARLPHVVDSELAVLIKG